MKQRLMLCWVLGLLLAFPLAATSQETTVQSEPLYTQSIKDWRSARHAYLKQPDGYLSQVGLEWLKQGENRVGSAEGNDIRLSGGPAYWGSVLLSDGHLRFVRGDDANVMIDGRPMDGAVMIPDSEGDVTTISAGELSFYVILRGSFALRIKDTQSGDLLAFHGVENFPIDPSWQINGRVSRADEGATLEIVNVLGQVSDSPVYGTFEFERGGNSHHLLALFSEGDKDLWFIFADRSSGHDTYGAGRFLHSDGMPEDGWLTLDFNKAYNPPCAFSPFSTCPLPPQENRLDLLVTAGEKDFHADSE